MIVLNNLRTQGRHLCRPISSQYATITCHNSMFAWKIRDSLNDSATTRIEDKLKYSETKIPTISSPNDVLVKVHSTSVNPLDVRMVYGYGRRVLDLLDAATNFEPRITNDRYPLTLGRDFSGEVVASGPCAREKYKPGDLVFGAVEPQKPGAHAQFVTTPSYCLTKKPDNMSHHQAASIPFVALTAYSGISTFGHLNKDNCNSKQVLIIGGSGGVGSFAIQLLKYWGANVVATCSESKLDWLENTLFVDQAIDHNDTTQLASLIGRFDFVLDCGAYDKASRTHQDIVNNSLRYLKPLKQSTYVTLSPPVLSNVDKHGLLLGTANTIIEAALDTYRGLKNLNSARWAFFLPNKRALEYISSLYQDGAIEPHLSSVFTFNQVPIAYSELETGKVRGKVVVDVTKAIPEQNGQEGHGSESSSENKDK